MWGCCHGVTPYVIDLSADNAELFDQQMNDWVIKSHRVPRKSATSPSTKTTRTDLGEIRAWAKDNGYDVSERGRVAKTIIDAYDNR